MYLENIEYLTIFANSCNSIINQLNDSKKSSHEIHFLNKISFIFFYYLMKNNFF